MFLPLIRNKNLETDGDYVLYNQDVFDPQLIIRIKNRKIMIINKSGEIINDKSIEASELSDYTHFTTFSKGMSDLSTLSLDFEVNIVSEKIYSDVLKQEVFKLRDSKDAVFFVYKNEKNNICIEVESLDPLFMSTQQLGWHELKLNESFYIKKTLEIKQQDVDYFIDQFNFFKNNRELREPNKKTNRGFDNHVFFDANNQESSLQESSVATADRIWIGVNNAAIKYNDIEYKEDSFEYAILNDQIENLTQINGISKFKRVLTSCRIEICNYYMDEMIYIFKQLKK